MELAERGPVMKLLPTEAVPPLAESEARDMFRQLLLGLEYRTFVPCVRARARTCTTG